MTALMSALRALSGSAAVAILASCNVSANTQQALPMQVGSVNRNAVAPNHGGRRRGFLGCPYPSGDVWQKNIARLPVDANSAAYIQAANDAGGGGGFVAAAPTTDEMINAATDATPLMNVEPKVKWHTPYSPWPWASSFYIEPLSDAHALVLQ